MAGKDKNKRGKILKINPVTGKILVEGINIYKKHQRPKKQGEKGEMVFLSRYIDASNAAVICGSCDKPVRIGYKKDKEGVKIRYCKKCQAAF